MRGHLNIAGKTAKANVKTGEDVLNPQLLVSRDLDAFYVVRTYERALYEGNVGLTEHVRQANQDLLPYLKFIDRQWLEHAESTKVDQPVEAV